MKTLRLAAVVLLSLAGAAAADQARVGAGAVKPHETKDRVSAAELHRMVAAPLARFEAGDPAGGAAAFEAQLARSRGSGRAAAIERADKLTAMGVELFNAANVERDAAAALALRRAGLAYLRRAIAATRAAFGAGDPELALAMADYVVAAADLEPDNPAADVDAYARGAYAIRLARLGPDNAETLSAMIELARIEGLPSRTGGDPGKVNAAIARLEAVRAAETRHPPPAPMQVSTPSYDEAEIYLANGQVEAAVGAFDRAAAAASVDQVTKADRDRFALQALRFASELNDRDPQAATRIRDQYSPAFAAQAANGR